MNEVLDSIHRLRSVREFSEQPVSDRDLQTILQAGVRACNASARQSYSIIVIKNRKTIEEYVGFSASVALLFVWILTVLQRWRNILVVIIRYVP